MKVKRHIQNHDELNHFDLRSDIENNNIVGGQLLFLGNNNDKNVWVIAIDNTDIRYEYTSQYEYNQDIKILIA
jgi:hypothetical protein